MPGWSFSLFQVIEANLNKDLETSRDKMSYGSHIVNTTGIFIQSFSVSVYVCTCV